MLAVSIVGFALCAFVLLQFGWWTSLTLRNRQLDDVKLKEFQQQLRRKMDDRNKLHEYQSLPIASDVRTWSGFRKFVVAKVFREAELTTSVYLKPLDEKPLPNFKPGQHLTFRFKIPGHSKPVVRCYSLSDGPNPDYYRITVKGCPTPNGKPKAPPGLVSHFVNQGLAVGDWIDVKAPGGSFCLDSPESNSIVMLAGGVGITPMTSMIHAELNKKSNRLMLLIYAVVNSNSHPFKKRFAELTQTHKNFQVITCYSSPLETDRPGIDYDHRGYANANLLEKVLPHRDFDYYMCGPPLFMSGLYGSLVDWGIQDEKIHFEAFGPASIKRVGDALKTAPEDELATEKTFDVEFLKSGKCLAWSSAYDNLLELAENNDIFLDSGCRSGNCGTCEIDVDGSVEHPNHISAKSGKCLACVAKPTGNLKIDA